MVTFAFIIHPIDPKRDVSRKFPLLGRFLNERQRDFFSTFFPPVYISEIEGIRSEATGKEIKGWFIACPYTPRRMMELAERAVYRKIIQTGRLAEKLGAQMLGLGAFTSVVGDAGITIAKALFGAGGTYLVKTTSNPAFEKGQRGPGHGFWERTGRTTDRAVFQAFILFDSTPVNGAPPRYVRGHQRIDQGIEMLDNDRWTSNATVQFFSSGSSTPISPSGCARANGVRMN